MKTIHITWSGLVELEPRLAGLANRAACGGDWRAWSNVTTDLRRLVGFCCDAPAGSPLVTSDAYEVAYRHLLEIFEDAGGGD